MLGLVLNTGNHYGCIVPELQSALKATGSHTIIDLCSGGGGPWLSMSPALEASGAKIAVTLTDLFPNLDAFQRTAAARANVSFEIQPVDATRLPSRLTGFRTLFSSFHHFNPEMAGAILADAVRQRAGIGIFEFTYRLSWPVLLLALLPATLATILLTLIAVPFVRPFRWTNLFWTYLTPFGLLLAAWDGTVSCMRTYTPDELLQMARAVSGDDYQWTAGTRRVWVSALPVTFLVGVPKAAISDAQTAKE